MSRVYNFSAGPAVLPLEVLQDAQKDLVDYKGCGMSVMEMSHRGKDYDAIHQEAVATFKELCGLGDDWAVCFIQGGASMQFAMIPMNFLGKDQSADYANQGTWSNKALKQAQMIGTVNVVANCQKDIPTRMPADDEFKWTPGAVYSHVCTNETISGAELKVSATCRATSSPASATTRSSRCSTRARRRTSARPAWPWWRSARSSPRRAPPRSPRCCSTARTWTRTPTWGIYIFGETMKWVKKMGKENLFKLNAEKAKKIYDVIDGSGFYRGTALKEYRSNMNVTWRLPTEELEAQFIKEAAAAGMKSLKGHRSVGGIRASIYNAFPMAGVDCLVDFMKEFEKKNG